MSGDTVEQARQGSCVQSADRALSVLCQFPKRANERLVETILSPLAHEAAKRTLSFHRARVDEDASQVVGTLAQVQPLAQGRAAIATGQGHLPHQGVSQGVDLAEPYCECGCHGCVQVVGARTPCGRTGGPRGAPDYLVAPLPRPEQFGGEAENYPFTAQINGQAPVGIDQKDATTGLICSAKRAALRVDPAKADLCAHLACAR